MTFEQLLKDKFDSLSPGQKKLAEYLIDHLEEAAFSKAAQIGRKVDVSETTVIRLSYALGFNGFSDMQEQIQRQLVKSNQQSHVLPPLDELDAINHAEHEKNAFVKVIENEILLLRQLAEQLNVDQMQKAVDRLIKADQILIVGFRASYAAAYWFSHTLGMLREHVFLCHQAEEFYEKVCNLTENSVVFVLSFPRYTKDSLQIANCAKKQGITLISVTDRMLSPVGRISDLTLTTEENAESGSNSIHSVISVLDMLIAGIQQQDKERIQRRQQKLEELYSSYEVFIE